MDPMWVVQMGLGVLKLTFGNLSKLASWVRCINKQNGNPKRSHNLDNSSQLRVRRNPGQLRESRNHSWQEEAI